MNTPIEDMELELKEQEIRQEQQQIQDSLTQMAESYRRAAETRSQELIKSYRTTLRVLLLVIALLVIAVIVVAVGWDPEQGTLVPRPPEVIKEKKGPKNTVIEPTSEVFRALLEDSILLSDST